MDLKPLQNQSLELLRNACFDYGILASPDAQDNYRRLWARDAMVAGIAALPFGDPQIMDGFRKSIETLAAYQHPYGMIPSNVLPKASKDETEISYGGLAGRVDATSWFIAGSCLYLNHSGNEKMQRSLQPNLLQALEILDRWEFNSRGLLYTPLSGNWADEYPVQGHTLYDNCLRLWALELYADLYEDKDRSVQARLIRERIEINFWPEASFCDQPAVYHPRAFKEAANQHWRHLACAIDPKGYNLHFDAAAHGLALKLQLVSEEQIKVIADYIQGIFKEIGTNLLPAFWPVIKPGDSLWQSLEQNYSFDFKNRPHHFHNGGIWPVWMGFFALGMSEAGRNEMAHDMLKAWMNIENPGNLEFYEYIVSSSLDKAGKKRLSYSASGLLFLLEAINRNNH